MLANHFNSQTSRRPPQGNLNSKPQVKKHFCHSIRQHKTHGQSNLIHTFEISVNGIKGPTVQLEHLYNLKSQDVLQWYNKFLLIANTNNWTDEIIYLNLQFVCDERLQRQFLFQHNPRQILDQLLTAAYPELDYRVYINRLNKIKKEEYENLTDYIQEIYTTTERANICLKDSPHSKVTDREIFEFFINGLKQYEQSILIERGILTIHEAQNVLGRIEATRTYYSNSFERKSNKNSPNNTRFTKYCRLHKNCNHTTEECNKIKSTKNIDKISHFAKKRMDILSKGLYVTPMVTINDSSRIKVFIDTGADTNYISPETVQLLNLKPMTISSFEVELGDGRIQKVSSKVNFEIKFDELINEEFHIEAFLLKGLKNTLNIGASFLSENNISIDIKNKRMFYASPNDSLKSNATKEIVTEKEDIKKAIHELVNNQKNKNPKNGDIPEISHEINLLDTKSIVSREYRVPNSLRDPTREILNEYIKDEIIKPSTSKYSSPAFIIPKKNGKHRLVIDYRRLNGITEKDTFPIPRIDDILADLHGSMIFSQIDLNAGFHQIKVNETDRYKTAFVIMGSQYEFNKMPFGMTNAPRTFQRAMSRLFGHLDYVKVYLDDLLIHSNTLEKHLIHLKEIFKIIDIHKISINFEKSNFMTSQVKYLGCIINEHGISPDISSITLQKFRAPTTKKELQRTLGFINYFRPFIPDLSQLLLPITDKLKTKSKQIEFSTNDEKILLKIKELIEKRGLLHHPEPDEPFILRSDASDRGIGAVLYQKGRVIRYFSQKLSASELNYTITEKECLAIVRALETFNTLVYGRKIYIETDNRNITFFKNPDKTRAQRWKMILENYNYELTHIPGHKNNAADYLSRLHSIQANELTKNDETKSKLRKLHEDLVHPGVYRTYMTAKLMYPDENIHSLVKGIVTNCMDCQINKNSNPNYTFISGNLSSNEPFEKIVSDIYGPIDMEKFQKSGKSYIISFVDVHSRYCQLYTSRKIDSNSLTTIFKTYLKNYPKPKLILTDQGTQYTSQEFNNICKLHQIKHSYAAAYNPSCNGIAEKLNVIFGNGLRILKNTNFKDSVKRIQDAYNSTFHSTIKTLPILASRLTIEPIIAVKNTPILSKEEVFRHSNIKASQNMQRSNSIRRNFTYTKGQQVLVKAINPTKIESRWLGPYIIQATKSNGNTLLLRMGNKTKWLNIKMIKPFRREQNVMNSSLANDNSNIFVLTNDAQGCVP